MITVRCHCGARVALYNPDTPSMWFVPVGRLKTRAGDVASNRQRYDAKELNREVTIVFNSDGSLMLSENRRPFFRWEHPTQPELILTFEVLQQSSWLASCQGCRERYPLGPVRESALFAERRHRASATLSAPSDTVTDN